MANTIAAEAYTEMRNGHLQAKIRTNTVASKIANIHTNKYMEFIRTPYRTDAVASSGTGRICEVDIQDFTVTDDSVQLQDYIAYSERVCPSNEAYTAVDLTKASMDEINKGLIEQIDVKLFADTLATVGIQTGTAITSAATAESSTRAVVANLAGYGGSLSDRFMVMDTDVFAFFLEAGATRQTTFGDGVIQTGDLFTYQGIDLHVVQVGQIAAATALAGIKGSIDLYLDEVGLRNEIMQDPNVTAADKINLNKVRVALMYVAVKVWEQKKKVVYNIA